MNGDVLLAIVKLYAYAAVMCCNDCRVCMQTTHPPILSQ